MIRTAVIGYGLSATAFHLPFIACDPHFELVAVSTHQRERAAGDWPDIVVYPTAEELLASAEADLIVATAPNTAHAPLTRVALARGCHVVLEKPIVNTLADGESLARIATEQNRLLVPFHNRRWDGDFLTVRHLIETGRLGRVHSFESHFDRFRPQVQDRWREQPGPGSGLWFDLGPHLIDQALCLFGPPQAVTARCLNMRPGARTTDYFHVLLHYPELEVILHASSFAAGPKLRFQVQGSDGCFAKYGLDPQEERLRAGIRPEKPDWSQESPEAFGALHTAKGHERIPTKAGGYQAFYAQLAKAIGHGAAVPVPLAEALTGVALIERAVSSSRAGRTLNFSGVSSG